MLVSTYMLAGHRHRTMRPGSGRASHYQHVGHAHRYRTAAPERPKTRPGIVADT
jgi:hypothetical protein